MSKMNPKTYAAGDERRIPPPVRTRFTPKDFARAQRGVLGPDWRWRTASGINRPRAAENRSRYDPIVLQAAEYLAARRKWSGLDERAQKRFAAIIQAESLNADELLTPPLKLMALGGISRNDMSLRTGITPEVLGIWESLFFDVREQREAAQWLKFMVIDPAMDRDEREFASRMTMAVMTGAAGVNLMLDAESRPPLDEADRLLRSRLRINLKLHQLADLHLTSRADADKWYSRFLRLVIEEARFEVARQKLELRCAERLSKHDSCESGLRPAERSGNDEAMLRQSTAKKHVSGATKSCDDTSAKAQVARRLA